MSFLELDANDEGFVSAKQMDELVKDDATIFMVIASMIAEGKAAIS